MAVTEAPKIVTARMGYDDSFTLERYLATGGYAALRKALTMTPEAVAAEVDAASLLGRGGAGFPAGRKWSMLRKDPVTYLVINGDESEPATFKDHLLIERDPHQILEGVLISAYALQVTQAFIYLRGEFALGLERLQPALNEAYAQARWGATSSVRGSPSTSWSIPVPAPTSAARRRRSSSRSRASGASRASSRRSSPPPSASTASPPWSTTSRRCPTSRGSSPTAARPSPRWARAAPPGPGSSPWPATCATRAPTSSRWSRPPSGTSIYAPVLGGGIRGSNTLKAFIPGGVSAPWFGPDKVDLPLGQDEVGNAGSMLGSGSVVVMDSATCMVRAAWRITKFFSRESCGQCTPCREGSGWLERIMYRIENGGGREEDLDLLMDLCDNISPAWPGRRSRRRSACSARRSRPPSRRASACSATSSWSTSRKGGAPLTDTAKTGRRPRRRRPDRRRHLHPRRREVTATKGELIIAAAERAGTYIPRFCYHPHGAGRHVPHVPGRGRGAARRHLSRPVSSQVGDGMVVDIHIEKAKKAQDGVLEFLLANHPLDCPVCDKGGECPLQDQTLAYGPGETRFIEEKRHFEKPIAISDLVLLDRERCIQCARCTRFADEVAGEAQIDFAGRGDAGRGRHLPDGAVLLLLQRQHRADLPGRRANGDALPLHGPPLGPRSGRVHLHRLLRRLPGGRAVLAEPPDPAARHRLRAGQPRLAVRQGPLLLRVGQRRRGRRRPAARRGGRRGRRRRARHGLPGRQPRRRAAASSWARRARPGASSTAAWSSRASARRASWSRSAGARPWLRPRRALRRQGVGRRRRGGRSSAGPA